MVKTAYVGRFEKNHVKKRKEIYNFGAIAQEVKISTKLADFRTKYSIDFEMKYPTIIKRIKPHTILIICRKRGKRVLEGLARARKLNNFSLVNISYRI